MSLRGEKPKRKPGRDDPGFVCLDLDGRGWVRQLQVATLKVGCAIAIAKCFSEGAAWSASRRVPIQFRRTEKDFSMLVARNNAQTHRKLNALLRGNLVGRILPSDVGKQTTKRTD